MSNQRPGDAPKRLYPSAARWASADPTTPSATGSPGAETAAESVAGQTASAEQPMVTTTSASSSSSREIADVASRFESLERRATGHADG